MFLRHEVDLATFATLTEQDLKEIGIQTFGARKKLLLLANSKLFSFHILNIPNETNMYFCSIGHRYCLFDVTSVESKCLKFTYSVFHLLLQKLSRPDLIVGKLSRVVQPSKKCHNLSP